MLAVPEPESLSPTGQDSSPDRPSLWHRSVRTIVRTLEATAAILGACYGLKHREPQQGGTSTMVNHANINLNIACCGGNANQLTTPSPPYRRRSTCELNLTIP